MNIKKSIFLVDDDEDDLFLLKQAIIDLKLDIDVCCARNGQDLLGVLNPNVKNAIILIDMNMPVMNGIETLRAIYATPGLKHLPSILLSTSNSPELKKVALDSGALQFICKPHYYNGYLKLMQEIYNSY